ncbi:HAMP domain-containing histidine kinase [Caminibacter mediatlanticus TB-2]|uniref:histidine kinase n=1 Tax=Caminibacter mediatlanticus TB-2 TaxID=391592 RepID=A0ABX5V7V9_9BACT|nr:HAMP domain-containing sensor histidine kinase [Caminibacter mediatlanticus]QCT94370.1 HAMP domain-containing histidine kinase [Caminibacter mediatlanticus TB-2]
MRNSRDFKFDLIFAFVIFAFLIVVSVTYTAIYIFSDLTTKEFKEKIKLIANNTYINYKNKEKTIEKTLEALTSNDIFNSTFNVNDLVIKSLFKTMLVSNSDLKEINFYNKSGRLVFSCGKYRNEIFCLTKNLTLKLEDFDIDKVLIKEKLNKKGIEFIAISPLRTKNNGFLEVKADFVFPKKLNTFYDLIIINNKGDIFYSSIKNYYVKNIFDLYNYLLANKILKTNEGFVSDDIYVKSFSKTIKFIFLQNKNVIAKTDTASQKMAFILLIISIVIAIPLGVFFSKPLYTFYEELDKRVKKEIEKRRKKEEILAHQSKLAALGEMLGNIAHQWRHPLTRLSLLIQNLEMAYKMNKLDENRFNNFKENAIYQINYMSQTIDDFTNFFKKDTKKIEFCPKDIINDALKLLEARIKQNGVEIVLDIKKIEPIYGYKTEFSQVILNIINNAIDVLKERNIENKKIFIRINGKKIEIEDNAGGIPENIKDKIFEPYFTTKFQSQGTGIGLYMSKVIITEHFNGKLYAYNSQNGAVFVIEV